MPHEKDMPGREDLIVFEHMHVNPSPETWK